MRGRREVGDEFVSSPRELGNLDLISFKDQNGVIKYGFVLLAREGRNRLSLGYDDKICFISKSLEGMEWRWSVSYEELKDLNVVEREVTKISMDFDRIIESYFVQRGLSYSFMHSRLVNEGINKEELINKIKIELALVLASQEKHFSTSLARLYEKFHQYNVEFQKSFVELAFAENDLCEGLLASEISFVILDIVSAYMYVGESLNDLFSEEMTDLRSSLFSLSMREKYIRDITLENAELRRNGSLSEAELVSSGLDVSVVEIDNVARNSGQHNYLQNSISYLAKISVLGACSYLAYDFLINGPNQRNIGESIGLAGALWLYFHKQNEFPCRYTDIVAREVTSSSGEIGRVQNSEIY